MASVRLNESKGGHHRLWLQITCPKLRSGPGALARRVHVACRYAFHALIFLILPAIFLAGTEYLAGAVRNTAHGQLKHVDTVVIGLHSMQSTSEYLLDRGIVLNLCILFVIYGHPEDIVSFVISYQEPGAMHTTL